MKKIKDLLLTQSKKKGNRRQSTTFPPGGTPIESTLPRHVRHEESPISPTSVPRTTSTPVTEQKSHNAPRRVFVSTPAHPSPLQQQLSREIRLIVKIRAKDHNLWFDGKEVERVIKKVESIAEIEGAKGRDIARQIVFWTRD
ncbi:hypothetical protein O181_119430 [Austropuccinia psidii MF-1]|uniref:Uncharacterized protein n=1 Tax=Austropuccinia psidii MF-1 TaxID=1389203 RepID=A0A9Q3KI84_9BASI|nr:hypothetical protein [Austropuccinia psidii MF-1]